MNSYVRQQEPLHNQRSSKQCPSVSNHDTLLIDREKQNTQLDYLQIFRLSKENGKQRIVHEQEQPKPFKKTYVYRMPETFTGKIYVIDDGDHETMLLAEEY